ncbi:MULTISPECIES: hypothetical protein [Polaribacter]|uniref:Uncharacterized protein n=1 Tax=Polaribacter butkevichii TaxID=218490 RepID=A0A2P6CCZ3_9FLAO|nr:hypothetical protein [Polaribacter butkevichii]PQJ72775.1 hypothetical protein BTO14_05670 [Polaribacter butkevichii]
MKQKQIVIKGKLNHKVIELIKEYYAVNRKHEIEGFIYSEKDLLSRHKNTQLHKKFLSANYQLVYTIDSCDLCFKSFDTSIESREHLSNYLNATYKLCNECKSFQLAIQFGLGIGLDGDIAI